MSFYCKLRIGMFIDLRYYVFVIEVYMKVNNNFPSSVKSNVFKPV